MRIKWRTPVKCFQQGLHDFHQLWSLCRKHARSQQPPCSFSAQALNENCSSSASKPTRTWRTFCRFVACSSEWENRRTFIVCSTQFIARKQTWTMQSRTDCSVARRGQGEFGRYFFKRGFKNWPCDKTRGGGSSQSRRRTRFAN